MISPDKPKSDTPRTDALLAEAEGNNIPIHAMTALARQLERERNEWEASCIASEQQVDALERELARVSEMYAKEAHAKMVLMESLPSAIQDHGPAASAERQSGSGEDCGPAKAGSTPAGSANIPSSEREKCCISADATGGADHNSWCKSSQSSEREKLIARLRRAQRLLDQNAPYRDGCDEGAACEEAANILSSERPRFEVELPDGDERKVHVWWSEKRPDGNWHISISVDPLLSAIQEKPDA